MSVSKIYWLTNKCWVKNEFLKLVSLIIIIIFMENSYNFASRKHLLNSIESVSSVHSSKASVLNEKYANKLNSVQNL